MPLIARWRLLALILAAGCQPDLGACDDDAARRPIYYDENGFPGYPGQALVEVSCGAGQFCHTQGIDPADRLGAPVGLDLDVAVAVEPAEVDERLRYARRVAWNLRHDIVMQVESGAMPPGPPSGDTALGAGAHYVANRGTAEERALPSIHSEEGLAILRNWLACGAHVIEATEGASQGVGDIVPRVESCPESEALCDGACVDVTASPTDCGACGVACGDGQLCEDRACRCLNGLAACGSSCVDLTSDNAHCGACGTSCGARFCAGGSCVDACPTGTTDCGGSCVDLQTSVASCGACGIPCEANEACVGGACACASGATRCGDECLDLASDPLHCGACDRACGASASCVSGACACGGGSTDCGGACVDTAIEPAHCGGCGVACSGGQGCAGGACVSCGPAVSFAGDVEPLLENRCTDSGCHGGARPAASLSLIAGRAYDELIGVAASCGSRPLVAPGDVDGSYLWSKLTDVGVCSGTQMPKRGQSLAASELAIIESWICRGAAND